MLFSYCNIFVTLNYFLFNNIMAKLYLTIQTSDLEFVLYYIHWQNKQMI